MPIGRYAILDAYTLEELKRQYDGSDPPGRIRLLKIFHRREAEDVTRALLCWASEDANACVRQWIARNGNLSVADKLRDRLRDDPDPFVRACLRENPTVFGRLASKEPEYFTKATPLERLAVMRNPRLDGGLVERLFDPDDTELGIDPEAREELICAFLSNSGYFSHGDNEVLGELGEPAASHLTRLWELASKWPPDSFIREGIYLNVPAADSQRAKTYRACVSYVDLRYAIVKGCLPTDIDTLSLAIQDWHEVCRRAAACKVRQLRPEVLESLLAGSDYDCLLTLASNKMLDVHQLGKVVDRLGELFEDGSAPAIYGADWLYAEMRNRELERRLKDYSEEWFDDHFIQWVHMSDKERAMLLERKVNLIGQKVFALERAVEEIKAELGSRL